MRRLDCKMLNSLAHAYVVASVQTIATLAADPVASLVDTAFIGHLGQHLPVIQTCSPSKTLFTAHAFTGAVQLAGVGIALSVYSTVTKLFNVPLLSVATSSVATAYGEHEGKHNPYLACWPSRSCCAVDMHVQSMAFWCTS